MKRKELKKLAQKIADCEKIIQSSDNEVTILQAQSDIVVLTSTITSFEDMIALDELIMEILEKK
jgi:hypothetical protein